MKETVVASYIGIIGGVLSLLFGGWDNALTTLVIFMAVDYITGLLVAGVFKKSKKTKNGALESRTGLKGICRKVGMLVLVLVACRLDLIAGVGYFRDATVIALVTNETISIIENLGLMDMPIPKPILKAIDILQAKGEEDENAKKEQSEDVL